MSGGSQHNPNGRQSQLGPGWSPLQMANYLVRAPQAHLASERGVTWHTPTPPPHLYHVPVPSPPDPLQVLLQLQTMKSAAGNSVYRHTATPPELYRHTPTPPDKHSLMRHTPSPGDVKAGAAIPPAELYPHLGTTRDKLRPEDILAYARGGVDLSLGSSRTANGSPAPAHSPALSVRDAPTINSLIARAQPRHHHARVDSLLERLAPSPASPHSVIMHSRAAPTPSPPSSNEDSADSCGGVPGAKRKRKPDRTVRVPTVPRPDAQNAPNGETAPREPSPEPPKPTNSTPPPTDKSDSDKSESISAQSVSETVPKETPKVEEKLEQLQETPPVEIATAPRQQNNPSESANVPVESPSEGKPAEPEQPSAEPTSFVEVENQLEKMFAGLVEDKPSLSTNEENEQNKETQSESLSVSDNADVAQSTSKLQDICGLNDSSQKLVEQAIDPLSETAENVIPVTDTTDTPKAKKRRKSAPTKGERKPSRRSSRASLTEETPRRKTPRKKGAAKPKATKTGRDPPVKDAYDSGSNASSSRSRGPYIQIRGPGDSPVSVCVVNAPAGDDDDATGGVVARRKRTDYRNGVRQRGLHASTLGLRYDASTPDASWLCVFCARGPHAHALGDLFGPYTVTTDCDEYRSLDETSRRLYADATEVWFHEACGVWAPGLVAAGARLFGLPAAVWSARTAICDRCELRGATLACAVRPCKARSHVPCAMTAAWTLSEEQFRAYCPRHAPTAD